MHPIIFNYIYDLFSNQPDIFFCDEELFLLFKCDGIDHALVYYKSIGNRSRVTWTRSCNLESHCGHVVSRRITSRDGGHAPCLIRLRLRRPGSESAARFQHRFGIESDTSNHPTGAQRRVLNLDVVTPP